LGKEKCLSVAYDQGKILSLDRQSPLRIGDENEKISDVQKSIKEADRQSPLRIGDENIGEALK